MKNFELSLPLENKSVRDIYYGETSGKEVIHELVGNEFVPPPKYMLIQVTTKSGKKISIHIPYDDVSDAVVFMGNELI